MLAFGYVIAPVITYPNESPDFIVRMARRNCQCSVLMSLIPRMYMENELVMYVHRLIEIVRDGIKHARCYFRDETY
jgi:hypothetical protein